MALKGSQRKLMLLSSHFLLCSLASSANRAEQSRGQWQTLSPDLESTVVFGHAVVQLITILSSAD